MTQPTDRPGIDQLRNLADRTERGALTGDEATRLRTGLDQLYREIDTLRAQLASRTVLLEGHLTWQTQRAERAETTLTAVRELATNMRDWDGDNPAIARWATDILAVLDQHGQTPTKEN